MIFFLVCLMMSDLKGILLLIYRQHNFTGNNSFPDIILTIDKMNLNGSNKACIDESERISSFTI